MHLDEEEGRERGSKMTDYRRPGLMMGMICGTQQVDNKCLAVGILWQIGWIFNHCKPVHWATFPYNHGVLGMSVNNCGYLGV